MSLYEGAVKKPIMTSLCFLAVAIFGLFSLSKLPVDLYPDIDTNTIMVMTSYQGASASDIETVSYTHLDVYKRQEYRSWNIRRTSDACRFGCGSSFTVA